MKNLKNKGLDKILTEEVLNKKKPFLGICLGMQLIAQKGFEPNECSGLGWIEGEVLKIQEKELRIPHLGWNSIETNQDSYLFDYNNKDFYFIHSYHFKLKEENKIAAWVNYGSKYVAAIKSENIFATQFHPEKSQEIGLNMIEKFIKENVKN
jgi:glutamine amidotransferase